MSWVVSWQELYALCHLAQSTSSCCCHLQDDLYKPNYYQALMDFREQTLQRLQKFVDQHFFQTMDYLKSKLASSEVF